MGVPEYSSPWFTSWSLPLAVFCIFCFHSTIIPPPPHPPTPLCFSPSHLLSLEGLEDHTQSQRNIMMIVLLRALLCLCPHSSKMKDGNNYLGVWCLKSFDIHLEEQVWFPAYGDVDAGLCFASITVHVKMANWLGVAIFFCNVAVVESQHLLAW